MEGSAPFHFFISMTNARRTEGCKNTATTNPRAPQEHCSSARRWWGSKAPGEMYLRSVAFISIPADTRPIINASNGCLRRASSDSLCTKQGAKLVRKKVRTAGVVDASFFLSTRGSAGNSGDGCFIVRFMIIALRGPRQRFT